jgi:hypothetical protein
MPGPGTFSAGDILTAADLNAIGVWESYTPTLSQNGTRTATVNYAKYVQINKLCIVNVDLTCTTSGSANNEIRVTLPVTASADAITGSGDASVGSGFFYDASTTDIQLTSVNLHSTTLLEFFTEAGTSNSSGLGANPNVTLANDDRISFSIWYLAA